ncbi:transcription repressor OFP12-like [Impatiens glandulifera]|uniref:transcription repressor OFP12-like n=1 Tax=Impatiens glandulifera TaxID=253017 RepID=UPI001FB18A12|nr:transcription repressor OFP12-like [Impatiens glandulifera]
MPTLMGRNSFMNLCFFTNFRNRSIPIINPKRQDHPRSLSNAIATAAADSSSIVKNFNSLYDLISDPDPPAAAVPIDLFTSSDSPTAATPDLSAVLASRRFFFSSPGRSNSIIDSFSSSSISDPDAAFVDSGGGVAIPTDSPDPYLDFRRSMEEMVEARCLYDVSSNWECLHELLLCYLALNPKSTHKLIVGAFSDLLVTLMDYPAMSSDRKRLH